MYKRSGLVVLLRRQSIKDRESTLGLFYLQIIIRIREFHHAIVRSLLSLYHSFAHSHRLGLFHPRMHWQMLKLRCSSFTLIELDGPG